MALLLEALPRLLQTLVEGAGMQEVGMALGVAMLGVATTSDVSTHMTVSFRLTMIIRRQTNAAVLVEAAAVVPVAAVIVRGRPPANGRSQVRRTTTAKTTGTDR